MGEMGVDKTGGKKDEGEYSINIGELEEEQS